MGGDVNYGFARFVNNGRRVVDTRFVNRYCLFIPEALKAWIDSGQRNPKTIHHQGFGRFIVDGETIELTPKTP